MEEKHQTSYDYEKSKKCNHFDDEEYWNKILEKRHDPIPAHVQAKLNEYNQQSKLRPSEADDDFDVTEAYIELRAQAEKAAEDEYRKIPLEQMIKESMEYYRTIPMYDFGLGKMSSQQSIADFYGWPMFHRIREEIEESYDLPNDVRKTGQISQKLWQQLKDIRAGRKPRPISPEKRRTHGKGFPIEQDTSAKVVVEIRAPNHEQPEKIEVIQRQRQPGDDYFMTIERGVIRNRSYRELFKGPSTLYQWIWANVVRSGWTDTKGYPIKAEYYDRGFLAYCSSYRQLARDCGLHKNKVKKFIDLFVEAGIMRVEHLVPKGKKRGQSVFIIGTWHVKKDKKGKDQLAEEYFIDDIFITRRNVSENARLRVVK